MKSKTKKHYDNLADKYDSLYADYLEHTHQHFIAKINIHSGDAILDLSCGTGLLAEKILSRDDDFNELVLNDFSEKMLLNAKNRLKNYSNINFTNYSANKLGYRNRSFTKIFCLNSFHYYHHQYKALRECRRVLQPEGTLYLLDWNRNGWFSLVNKLIDIGGRENINTRSASEAKDMLQTAGFKIVSLQRWRYKWWKFYFIDAQV